MAKEIVDFQSQSLKSALRNDKGGRQGALAAVRIQCVQLLTQRWEMVYTLNEYID
jgi:hypothetical protein